MTPQRLAELKLIVASDDCNYGDGYWEQCGRDIACELLEEIDRLRNPVSPIPHSTPELDELIRNTLPDVVKRG